jgi:hypothetical protein
MYYNLDWEIKFKTGSKTFKLLMLLECEIEKNVENLADVAVITLPETVLNQALKVKDKIGRGSEVTIKTGYNGNLKTEFIGFVRDITTDGSLKIHCEDALFLFRKGIKDKMLKPTSVKKIAEYVCAEIGEGYKVVVEGDLAYEKFVIHQANGYDVLMKLQEETHYNIYFDTEKKELHIHPPFIEKKDNGYVIYCMQKNIEKSSLEYKKAIDRKFELTIEKTKKDGTVITEKIGQSGGETKTVKVGTLDAQSIKMRAESEFKEFAVDKYEGSFDAWLIPYCEPTYSAKIVDFDYPEQSGIYYVKSTKVTISSSGGVRTITPGIKLATVK